MMLSNVHSTQPLLWRVILSLSLKPLSQRACQSDFPPITKSVGTAALLLLAQVLCKLPSCCASALTPFLLVCGCRVT